MRSRTSSVFRPIDGILLLDKPAELSSSQALQRARRCLLAAKGGHTGSLDPLATGLLPLCFGEATKIAGLLLGNRKAYRTRAVLGATTDTCDADGVVLELRPVAMPEPDRVQTILQSFVGRIMQRPPVYSALKQGGEPLYAKARRGEQVEVAERAITIESIRLVAIGDAWLDLEVVCGSGTYIRSLVRDIGEQLGCGAHVGALRRLGVEPFVAPEMIELEAFEAMTMAQREACLLPIEAGLSSLPQLTLDAGQSRRLRLGQRLDSPAGWPVGGQAVAFAAGGRSIGLVEIDETGVLHPRRLFNHSETGP